MKKIVFFGDSITDAGREKEKDSHTGHGYVTLVKASLGFENPGEYEFINRGVNGNRVVDLYARVKKDLINLQPDFVSILVGVNDVWHEISKQNGSSPEKFEKIYNMMLDEIIEALPHAKIMIMCPFVFEGCNTCDTEERPDRWQVFSKTVPQMANAAKKVAEKHKLPYVELQQKFDGLCKKYDSKYWVPDGVHPSAMGHELIKNEWLQCFEKLSK